MGVGGDVLTALLEGGDERAIALACPEESIALSFRELKRRVSGLAKGLGRAGVQGGDRVAFALSNGPEPIELLLAVTLVGAAAAPLNPSYTADEYAFFLRDLGPRLFVIPPGNDRAARAAAGLGLPTAQIALGAGRRHPRLSLDRGPAPGRSSPALPSPDGVALLLHTSGTTGRPRLVPLLHRNLMSSARAIAACYRLSPSDRSLCAMPLFHVHGLVGSVFSALASGGGAIVPRRVAAQSFWRQMREYDATWYSATPTIHQMLIEKAGKDPATPDLRFVRSCSSALAPALLHRLEERLSVPALEAYGMTEASHQIASNPLPPRRRVAGSVGIATRTELCVVDPDGNPLPEGATGEVVVRGPGVMSGYLGDADANAQAFVDGWFRTGDLGVLENSYLRLQGRLKEMIIRGGENISPYEIEETLLAHRAVADAACFGTASVKYGEEVAAAVVTLAPTERRELLDHCRERLASFKVPKAIFFVDVIPRTATGKIRRRQISAELQERD